MNNFLLKTNKIIKPFGYKISQLGYNIGGYISATEIVSSARREGISVCDYIEKMWDIKGQTQLVIDNMDLMGSFNYKSPKILEIGAGTGRYMEKIITKTSPQQYESYETAKDWSDWLSSTYKIISQKADGLSLKDTTSGTIDLLHSHGVIVYLPLMVSWSYFLEISRVMKKNGTVVFDIYSEKVMDKPTVIKWINSNQYYPTFLSKDYVVSIFSGENFTFIGEFLNKHGEGKSHYLVFRKN